MKEVRIPAHAKVNLRLEVLGKRADGYHELRTIFQTVSLHDSLRLRSSRQPGITLSVTGNESFRRTLEKNLVYRAVDALRRELKVRAVWRFCWKSGFPPGEAWVVGPAMRQRRCWGTYDSQKRKSTRPSCCPLPQDWEPMCRFSCLADAL